MPYIPIVQIEAAIIDRLRSRIQDVVVDAYPDKPESYQLKHPAGALLVRYTGSRFGPPDPTDVVAQQQTVTVEVVSLVRNLHKLGDHAGLLDLLDAVRTALTGFRIPGGPPLHPTTEEFKNYADGIWEYATAFETSMAHTEPARTRPKIEYTEGVGYADDQPTL